MRILVGFDGSEGGRDALELTRLLASGDDGSALVATVLFGGPLPIDLAGLGEDGAREAEPIFEEARARLAGIELEARAFGGGSPGAILTALAEGEEPDAIVVGSPHRGALGRVLIGSVARNLLSGAPCDVVVAPHGYATQEHGPFRTIAVGYDGSPEAKQALKRAEELARPSNATIKIVVAVSMPVVVPGGVGYTPTPVPTDPEGILDEAVASLDPRLGVERLRSDGSPAMALVDACEDGVDLLVLGSRGYGPLARVLLGSVSRSVAQDAPCPVWVVPRP